MLSSLGLLKAQGQSVHIRIENPMATRWWQVPHCLLQWPLGDHVSQVRSQLGHRCATPGLGYVWDLVLARSGYINCVVLSHSMSDKPPIWYYRKTSNISRTLVCNKIVDNSDVVGASPVGAAPTTSSFSNLTPGFNGLSEDKCKRIQDTLKFWDLVVRFILKVLRFYEKVSPGFISGAQPHEDPKSPLFRQVQIWALEDRASEFGKDVCLNGRMNYFNSTFVALTIIIFVIHT